MFFYAIGIDHNNASLEIREAAIRKKAQVSDYLTRIKQADIAALFTCNRVEIYGIADNYDEAKSIDKSLRILFPDIFKDAYLLLGRDEVFKHGVRLALGLESYLRGEYQIFLQIENWARKESLTYELRAFWNEIMSVSKYIRKASGLDENTINIADLIFADIAKRSEGEKSKDIIVVGTGKIADLIADRAPDWAAISFVARKKRKKAQAFAKKVNGKAFLPDEIRDRLGCADALISATSSPHYIFDKSYFAGLKRNRQEPLYIYDAAVPRDIEPAAADVDAVSIVDIEDIVYRCNSGNELIKTRLERAENLSEKAISAYRVNDENTNRVKA
ncbi:MAG: hypothetical protein ABH843_06535 [Candidatus Omnitrophota bacterium]